MAHAIADAELRNVLPEIQTRTLLLLGEHDERSPLAITESSAPLFRTPSSASRVR